MKVVIFGGTGFVGRNVAAELLANGDQVFVVTRNRQKKVAELASKVKIIEWDNHSSLSASGEWPDADVIINLAGESIGNRRWSNSVKREILASRMRTTRAIMSAINDRSIQPKVLINASAVGYYGSRQDEKITEIENEGNDFLAHVCRDWEKEAYKAQSDLTRVVTLRIGVVLGREGALNRMITPYKFYMGGPLGTGNQWLSWIHITDLTRIIKFVIENQEITGPVNATAPEPVTMKAFSQVLGKVMNRPSWLPIPGWLLKIALGEMSETIVNGQRVIPHKLIRAGFQFQFSELTSALADIWRKI